MVTEAPEGLRDTVTPLFCSTLAPFGATTRNLLRTPGGFGSNGCRRCHCGCHRRRNALHDDVRQVRRNFRGNRLISGLWLACRCAMLLSRLGRCWRQRQGGKRAATRLRAKHAERERRATGPRTDLPSRTRATRRASEFFDGRRRAPSKAGHSWRATPRAAAHNRFRLCRRRARCRRRLLPAAGAPRGQGSRPAG